MFTPKGKFGWYELMTTDTDAAGKFYSDVVGWTTNRMDGPTGAYTIFNIGETGMAGMLTIPEDAKAMGKPPSWIGYISVEDVDAHVVKIVEAGGTLCQPAMDVPGMLRFAVVADPTGAAFVVFTPNPAMPTPANRPVPPAVGTTSWHELYAGDLDTAWTFYSAMFGWEKIHDMDMQAAGVYRIFGEGEVQMGGMMTKDPHIPAPFWNFYFQVEALSAAIEKVKAGGGSVSMGPMQVPGGGWIIQGKDPQGALFSLVSANA